MGKSCISLANAMEEMKNLSERLKTLEERAAKQTIVEPAVSVNHDHEQTLPEIQARVCSKNILLKIQCVKRKGVLVKLLEELDNLSLDVASASVVGFGSLGLDITITAEMENDFSVPVKDVATVLRLCLEAAL